jgi:undecaprenyl-diphosphatase
MNDWGPELAVILGVVEGLTEFLPVSSTGHLILVGHYLGFTGQTAASIDISIQLGSVLAIIAYERAKLASLFSEAYQQQAALRSIISTTRAHSPSPTARQWREILGQSAATHRSLWFLVGVFVAFCPAALVGLLAHDWIKTYLFTPQSVAAALILGGLIILGVEARPSRASVTELKQVSLPNALWVGIAQCCSLFPGISRSGATIVGGLLVGLDRRVATEFSFFLALPTLIAATVYQMVSSRSLLTTDDALALALGLVVAFFVAWAVIAALLTFVKRHTLRVFGYYRIVFGIAILVALD